MSKELKVKIFGGSRFQDVEADINKWLEDTNPFIVKSHLQVTPIFKEDKSYTFFFSVVIFYNPNDTFYSVLRKEGD